MVIVRNVELTSSSSILESRGPVYTSASLHLFIGRPQFLLPTGVASCTLLTKRSSAIHDMCILHSVLLLCTQDIIVWIPHISRILSFSHFVDPCFVYNSFQRFHFSYFQYLCSFAVSVRVSVA